MSFGACTAAALAPAVTRGSVIIGVGDLPGGNFNSAVTGLSADGGVASGYGVSGAGTEAFRWTARDGLQRLDAVTGDAGSFANDISGNGQVIVGISFASGGPDRAIRWTASTGPQAIGALPGGALGAHAYGTNADGSVVVGLGDSTQGRQAFRWTQAGGIQGLGDLPGGAFDSWARHVSADGSVVVGYGTSAAGQEAFRWTSAGGMQSLGVLPGGEHLSDALNVSPDGRVVVGFSRSAGGTQAFRWTAEEGMVGLGDLPGGRFDSGATAVSADGSVVYGSGTTEDNSSHAFVWDPVHGMRDFATAMATDYGLDLGGWNTLGINAVSADGLTLAGTGVNPAGNVEGFIIQVPEPAGAVTLLAIALPLVVRRRRRT